MNNDKLTATTDDAKVVEILQSLTRWHEKHVTHLRQIAENKADRIVLGSVELVGDMRTGFVLGVQVALDCLGELPLKMEKSDGVSV